MASTSIPTCVRAVYIENRRFFGWALGAFVFLLLLDVWIQGWPTVKAALPELGIFTLAISFVWSVLKKRSDLLEEDDDTQARGALLNLSAGVSCSTGRTSGPRLLEELLALPDGKFTQRDVERILSRELHLPDTGLALRVMAEGELRSFLGSKLIALVYRDDERGYRLNRMRARRVTTLAREQGYGF